MYDETVNWLHWMKVNISTKTPGNTLMSYTHPTPPSGIHTYKFLLYRQLKPITFKKAFTNSSRRDFGLDGFVKNNNLTLVSTSQYRVRKYI